MRLHIVRHGQTDWNAVRRIQGQLDSRLDDTGIQQATDRGADFAKMHLQAVYSSSSLRTRQTTALILGDRAEHVIFRDDLREVTLGVWEGQYWADVEKKFPELVDAHAKGSADFIVEGAENSQQVQERGVAAIEDIISSHNDAGAEDNILIVSHGAIMKTILAFYTDTSLQELYTLPSLPNCAHCIIDVNNKNRHIISIASQPVEQTPWAKAPRNN